LEKGAEYRPFCDLRSVPEAGQEQVENQGRTCTQVLFLGEAELRFFHFLKIVTCWLVPSIAEDLGFHTREKSFLVNEATIHDKPYF
jgi:hypothetical protein